MTTVLVVAHHERHEAAELVDRAVAWLGGHRGEALMTIDDATAIGRPGFGAPDAVERAELCLSIGGDGTMLRAVHLVAQRGLPVLGVNVGLLGYLTEIEPSAMEESLGAWLNGANGWHIEERMMLGVTALGRRWLALNECVVERDEPGHTVRVRVHIDGHPFTSYAADGLIVSTPTGSTAYSLSVRGPVISPSQRAVIITPVAPHMLFDRTLVLGTDEDVMLELIGHRPAVLTVDGQIAILLNEGDRVEITSAVETAKLVRFGERKFHQILKAKFGLTDR